MGLVHLLTPDQYLSSIEEIDLDDLEHAGVEAVICDLDNTLVPFGSEEIAESTKKWLREVRDRGFRVVLLSNAMSNRVERLAARLDVPAIAGATKPRAAAYHRAMQVLGAAPGRCAAVGDQLFTDVVGGNRMGMQTILVLPLSRRDFFMTKILRLMERWTICYLQRRGCTERPEG